MFIYVIEFCMCLSIYHHLSVYQRIEMSYDVVALGLLGLGSMMNFPLSMGDFQDQAVHLPESTGWILGQNEENIM